jgi:L-methionine (R)-S-oxide reductase
VCGAAAQTGKTQLVPDVDAFPGHIACDGASRSEIVVPIVKEGKVRFPLFSFTTPVPSTY